MIPCMVSTDSIFDQFIPGQIALDGQGLPRTYLAHYKLESVVIINSETPGNSTFSNNYLVATAMLCISVLKL